MAQWLKSLFGDGSDKIVKKYQNVVTTINDLELTFESFSLEQLKAKTVEFKERLKKGETLDEILPEAFAAVREASKRTLGQRHYDVQLIGGIALHEGNVAQMRTGEGKTLSATLAVYLNAIQGKGVHVVTVNDFLSQRDAAWMGQIYNALGMTTACINHQTSYIYDPKVENKKLDEERDEKGSFKVVHEFLREIMRREAYEADITYGTNNEFGFDYLRDNMAPSVESMVQAKGHNYAIVDEVDSILIDESRTPLIISAPDSESNEMYKIFAKIVPSFKENIDYNVDEKLKASSVTEEGINKVEKALNIKNIYEEGGTRYVHHLEQALKAQVLFHLDKDYVVKDGQVIIVDEFTGRMMPGRRWSGGLHQAVEAKEGVLVQKESRTLATITFQNYFRLYSKLSGMTGTGKTSEEEFQQVYNLNVIVIPTHKPMLRVDLPDKIYKTEIGKMKSIAKEVKERQQKGQPVLIGTVSIEKNELISTFLNREGVDHKILNAKKHEQEGEIIAQAGRFGAVTVATNMAGRGVDVILGGNPVDEKEHNRVIEVGGLHVIGTERHEARRIDDQLRGRSGRQGDIGSSQFFVSTEDDVARIFGGDRMKSIMNTLGVGEEDAIENRLISSQIEKAQERIEGHHFDSRKYVLAYDDIMNRHRRAIYNLRRSILESNDNKEIVTDYISEQIDLIVNAHVNNESDEINIKEIVEELKTIIPLQDVDSAQLISSLEAADDENIKKILHDLSAKAYLAKSVEQTEANMRKLERAVLLRVIDDLWVDHLEAMEELRDSVRLRAYGQRDPLVEYKVEGQRIFNELQATISQQVATMIYKVGIVQQKRQLQTQATHISPLEQKVLDQVTNKSNDTFLPQSPITNPYPKVGRNDPCPCGSGKKYKKCGLINASEHKYESGR